MKILKVKLENYDKSYLFECPNNLVARENDIAVCHTAFGYLVGRVEKVYYMSNNCIDIITLKDIRNLSRRTEAVFNKRVEKAVIDNYLKEQREKLRKECEL